jgi:LPS sulfotransferase NodH
MSQPVEFDQKSASPPPDRPRLEVSIYQIADDRLLKENRADGSGWDWCWADWQRNWMEASQGRFAYRCLPLSIANQTGLWIKNPVGFTAIWRGEDSPGSIDFTFDVAGDLWGRWVTNIFGLGIVTWNTPFLFRTKPDGSRLLVSGPANHFKDNIHALTAIIESDWMNMSFTMNWKIMRPHEPVRFEAGEPLFQAIPLSTNVCSDLEDAAVVYKKLDDDPEVARSYREWDRSRSQFTQQSKAGELKPDDWQRDYFLGRDASGRRVAPAHMTKVKPPKVRYEGTARPPHSADGPATDGRPASAHLHAAPEEPHKPAQPTGSNPRVTHSYLISSTPRTGSFLLAEALESTGVAGRPREYFDPSFEKTWFDRLAASADAEYLTKVLGVGSTANGVFGAKVHWHQLEHLTTKLRRLDPSGAPDHELLRRTFPGLRYVFLTRRDKVRQAVSYDRAIKTGVWWLIRQDQTLPAQPTVPPPQFDFEQIDHWVNRLTFFESSWRRYFQNVGLEPLEVVYEDFVEGYESTVRAILRYLDLPFSERVPVASPRLQKQADALSEEWVERYRHEKSRHRNARRPIHLSYFISTAPRTGSGVLAEALESTRVAGIPKEYFDPNYEHQWRHELGISVDNEYFDKILPAGTTSNGVFGAKVHWYQFEHLTAKLRKFGGSGAGDLELLRRMFPDLRYIFLTRKDKVRQAVSYYRAITTGVWWSFRVNTTDNGYSSTPAAISQSDFEQIDFWVRELANFESRWRRHFESVGVQPFEVAYEDFVESYESTVREVLDYLGLPASAGLTIAPPRLQKQADAISEQWVRRYLELKATLPVGQASA